MSAYPVPGNLDRRANLTYDQAQTIIERARAAGAEPVLYFGSEPGRVAVVVRGGALI